VWVIGLSQLREGVIAAAHRATAHRAVGRVLFNPPSRTARRVKGNPPYADESQVRTITAPSSPSFAEITVRFAVTRPILRKQPGAHVAVKRGIRPIAHPRNEAMLERIDVAVFDVTRIIRLVADQVLPEPALPVPRSLRATRTALSRSCFGSARANRLLISRQRVEKSQSPGGSCQIVCR